MQKFTKELFHRKLEAESLFKEIEGAVIRLKIILTILYDNIDQFPEKEIEKILNDIDKLFSCFYTFYENQLFLEKLASKVLNNI